MIVYHLAFLYDQHQHGGKNRSEQLHEWIKKQHPEAVDWEKASCPNPVMTLFYGLVYAIFWQSFKPFGKQSVRMLGHEYYAAKSLLKQYPETIKIYIEGTGFGTTAIAKYFRAKGVKCYFMPCNLESLVPYENLWSHKIAIDKRFAQEIKALRYAEKVYAISFTEHWLLELFGVCSELLPYTPVGPTALRCAEIKEQRALNHSKKGLVYLANFKNGPNAKALSSFIEAYKSNRFNSSLPNGTIHVLGRGLADLKLNHCEGLDYVGEVNDVELDAYLINCSAVILYHYPTSGTLTRLEEYKAMGIPIYANEMAIKQGRYSDFTGISII